MSDYRVGYVFSGDEPVAVFLDSARTCPPGYLKTYSRTEGHSEASTQWIAAQPYATEDQAYDLHAYLKKRYAEPTNGEPLNLVVEQEGLPG